jgi:hypothetical protein
MDDAFRAERERERINCERGVPLFTLERGGCLT